MRSVYFLDRVLPLVPLPFGQNIQPYFLDKLNHLQFGLHLRPTRHYPLEALRRRKQFEGSCPHSLILLAILKKKRETVKGGDAVCKLVQMDDLVFV